jgi:uncharacterized membrane protein YfcA
MNDIINGIFELGGGILLIINCFKLYKDKEVKGVSISVCAFFTVWGCWNLYFYPSLGQWVSFAGGVLLVTVNLVWVFMAIYYSNKEQ